MLGRELGDYKLLKQLGRGSLGTTYLAEHRYTQKHYTLKILPEELAGDRAFMQRFQEDIARLAALDHPHLVAIHNVSFCEGTYFLVTDCIVDEVGESTNLYRYLKAQNDYIDEEALLHHLLQLAQALDYAHVLAGEGKSLIHRGIKLSNILVGRQRDGQREGMVWYLSDFGLSRIIGCGAVLLRACKVVADTLGAPTLWAQAAGEEVRYPFPPLDIVYEGSLQHSFLQTFAFLAPEQKCIDGVASITYKADIYAFGVLTYYLLTQRFAEGIFPLPSEVRPELIYNWDGFIRTCLQTTPDQRPERLTPALQAVQEVAYADNFDSAAQRQEEADNDFKVEENPRPYHQMETIVKHYQPERKEVKNPQPLLSELVVIPAGHFWRGSVEGSRDEMPCHQVSLESFAIDIHPVTNEQFVRFLEMVGSEKDSFHRDLIRLRDARIKRSGGKLSIESGYAKHPVVGVTWYGAMAYAKWIGRRLPTEAEWEIAAAGAAERHIYPSGNEIEKSQANFFSSDTTAVMSYAPTCLGLYDMAGNVYEWCYDWYGYNYYEVSQQEPSNPTGPLQGNYRVLRGVAGRALKKTYVAQKGTAIIRVLLIAPTAFAALSTYVKDSRALLRQVS